MGRKPKPPELRLLDGTHRRDRHGDPSARLELGALPAAVPEGLQKHGAEAWERLMEAFSSLGVLKQTDFNAAYRYCECFDMLASRRRVLRKDGRYIMTEKGGLQRHPATIEEREILDRMRRYESEFGLTPSSRSSVRVDAKPKSGIKRRVRA